MAYSDGGDGPWSRLWTGRTFSGVQLMKNNYNKLKRKVFIRMFYLTELIILFQGPRHQTYSGPVAEFSK